VRRLTTVALMLLLAVASAYAHEAPVKMKFSGTSADSVINLQQPGTSNDEDTFAGEGSFGSFTVRNVRAIANAPSVSSTCAGANDLYLLELAGTGVFRFQDGSLLEVNLTQGSDCIDLMSGTAHCVLAFQVTGGTGRFKNASGSLTMTETVQPVTFDTLGNPVFFAATGEFNGKLSGVKNDKP
jgi:hypothetical protein